MQSPGVGGYFKKKKTNMSLYYKIEIIMVYSIEYYNIRKFRKIDNLPPVPSSSSVLCFNSHPEMYAIY